MRPVFYVRVLRPKLFLSGRRIESCRSRRENKILLTSIALIAIDILLCAASASMTSAVGFRSSSCTRRSLASASPRMPMAIAARRHTAGEGSGQSVPKSCVRTTSSSTRKTRTRSPFFACCTRPSYGLDREEAMVARQQHSHFVMPHRIARPRVHADSDPPAAGVCLLPSLTGVALAAVPRASGLRRMWIALPGPLRTSKPPDFSASVLRLEQP